MELSVVIPVYNEEENVEPLMREVDGVLSPLGRTYEIVAVDDGSKDATFMALRKIRCRLPPLKIVRLKRNFGQTAALAAGLAYANGDIIVLMDGDRQNDPADIPALIECWRKAMTWSLAGVIIVATLFSAADYLQC